MWFIIGTIVYLFYGSKHSKLNDQVEALMQTKAVLQSVDIKNDATYTVVAIDSLAMAEKNGKQGQN